MTESDKKQPGYRKQTTVKIDEDHYVIQEFTTDQSFYWLGRLGHIFSGGLNGVGDTPIGDVQNTPLNIGRLIQGALDRIAPDELPKFMRAVVSEGLVAPDLDSEDYGAYFQGKTDVVLQLVAEIFAFNYANMPTLKKTMQSVIGPLFTSLQPQEEPESSSDRQSTP